MASTLPLSETPPTSRAVESRAVTLLESTSEISATHTAELVIALCGPIGSPLHEVATSIEDHLVKEFGYDECRVIRLSSFIKQYAKAALPESGFALKQALIEEGDQLRKEYGHGILAELAIRDIAADREKAKEDARQKAYTPRRVCHIIDSIKNQSELEVLRLVYRDMLYSIGVFSPLHERQKNLKRTMSDPEISQLIDRDSGEEIKHGQTVRDTFPQADFFLRVESDVNSEIVERVKRYLHLILGSNVMTPAVSETAMYLAASAAGNSACLSRQVGAALTDEKGEVLAVGWNDVPKAGGNLYTYDPQDDPTNKRDFRCWNKGQKCFNDEEKGFLAETLVSELVKKGIIEDDKKSDVLNAILANKKLRNLIEFSRSIHAEMHAIIQACQVGGERVRNGKIFLTTYPCHSCARHIIAAGIKEVYYIEPYIKSLATKLHDDAITENETDKTKVRILAYDGVAPSRYLKLFWMIPDSRKKDGKLIKVDSKVALPKFDKSMEALTALEGIVVKGLEQKQLV